MHSLVAGVENILAYPPVLLVFCYDDESQQFAETLYVALQLTYDNLQLVKAVDLCSASHYTSRQFHEDVLKTYKSALPPSKWLEHLRKQQGSTSAKLRPDHLPLVALKLVSGATFDNWHGENFHHVSLSEADCDEQTMQTNTPAAKDKQMQAYLITKLESCDVVPDFLGSDIKEQRQNLQAVLAEHYADTRWQRAAVAAFLLQDQDSLANLNTDISETSKMELLVTLIFKCSRFCAASKPILSEGVPAQCDISLQLYAYAKRKLRGKTCVPHCILLLACTVHTPLVSLQNWQCLPAACCVHQESCVPLNVCFLSSQAHQSLAATQSWFCRVTHATLLESCSVPG